MNQMPYPYIPNPYNGYNPYQQTQPFQSDELSKIKLEINKLKERITKLEQMEKKDYLQKEDGFYMM